jgi:hypothetical protein
MEAVFVNIGTSETAFGIAVVKPFYPLDAKKRWLRKTPRIRVSLDAHIE